MLLAPRGIAELDTFKNFNDSPHAHANLLASAQRMRGAIYLAEGAIQSSDLTQDGRHVQAADESSWHLLSVSTSGEVLGCARFHHHTNSVGWASTGVSRSSLACDKRWGSSLRRAVEAEMARARRESRAFVEFGGWALSEDLRCSSEGLRIALAAYSWSKLIGGVIGLTTATVRHKSAQILQKLGGVKLSVDGVQIPRYFDPAYGCDMEILRFSDDTYAAGCHDAVVQLMGELSEATVVVSRRKPWDCVTGLHSGVYAPQLAYA